MRRSSSTRTLCCAHALRYGTRIYYHISAVWVQCPPVVKDEDWGPWAVKQQIQVLIARARRRYK
jgi:hypothetical protein